MGQKKWNHEAAFSSERILNMQGRVDFPFSLIAFSLFYIRTGLYAAYINATVLVPAVML